MVMKYTVDFFYTLRDKKIKLYLMNRADLKDVREEAEILCCKELFDGGIYGEVNDIKKFS